MGLILTVLAHQYFKEAAKADAVESVRLNTTLPINGTIDNVLRDIQDQAGEKDVWIDLKTRQLRVTSYNVEILNDGEIHYIGLSHPIKVDLPTQIFLDDGNFVGEVIDIIKGSTLVVPSSVEREQGLPLARGGQVGIRPSMSVNILDSSLEIQGFFTEKDKKYIEGARKVGLHNYMLSYVEEESDITELLALDPEARIVAKIESKKGLEFVKNTYPKYKNKVTLMAARGDLYVELERPDLVIDACEQIIKADEKAIFASRLLESLKDIDSIPKCQDLFDLYAGLQMGFKRFMIGDGLCTSKVALEAAINIYDIIQKK